MVGCVQGLLVGYKAGSAPPVSGNYCTSFQVSVACCTSTGVCAASWFGQGASCSPASPEGVGWTSDC